jgi:anti-sigma B factor antagonist
MRQSEQTASTAGVYLPQCTHPVMISFISRAEIPVPAFVQTGEARPVPVAVARTLPAMLVGASPVAPHNPSVTGEAFRVEHREGRTVRLIGELDLASFELAMAELEPLLAQDGDLELDLTELTFLDSSGIRVLVKCRTSLDGRGSLVLRGASPHVRKILEIAGLADLGVRSVDPGA